MIKRDQKHGGELAFADYDGLKEAFAREVGGSLITLTAELNDRLFAYLYFYLFDCLSACLSVSLSLYFCL